jgi:hypothetical protein
MRSDSIPTLSANRSGVRRDAAAALLLAFVLALCWLASDWSHLRYLDLPDSDDVMRLAQVRDWIAGQSFNDWTQYRLAPPAGAPMHWSRINDLGIAGIIVGATPLLGRHGAELLAVILYPTLLFAAYLFLSARIGRRLWGRRAAWITLVLAAIAFPALGLFRPGRIDHHALQIVLTVATVLALTRRASIGSGVAAGLAMATSLAVGLETAPAAAGAMVVLFGGWVWRGAPERGRLLGFVVALAGVTLLLLAFARPTLWTTEWCDTFTPASSTATLVGAALFAALAMASGVLRTPSIRLVVGAVAGTVSLAALAWHFPTCITGPYGAVDPFVRQAFIDNVVEAAGLFEGTVADAFAAGGLIAAALIVGCWFAWRRPRRRALLAPSLAVLAFCAIVTVDQIRGAYIGSALAAPVLAGLILAARSVTRHRPLVLAGAWLVSAGVVHATLPAYLIGFAKPADAQADESAECYRGDTWQRLDRLPTGVVMAPMNLGARIIGGTRHATIAASYHRNNRGNRASYDFFLSAPDRARAIATTWRVTYVALCPDSFGELGVRKHYPHSLATALEAGRTPPWLQPIPLPGAGLRVYRIVR